MMEIDLTKTREEINGYYSNIITQFIAENSHWLKEYSNKGLEGLILGFVIKELKLGPGPNMVNEAKIIHNLIKLKLNQIKL